MQLAITNKNNVYLRNQTLHCKSLHKLTFYTHKCHQLQRSHSNDKLLWKLMYKLCFRIIKVCIYLRLQYLLELCRKQNILHKGIHHPRIDS